MHSLCLSYTTNQDTDKTSFSQAWRKRPVTLGHTRYVTQCLEHLANCREYTTDSLITPMIQLSALLGRINDYFSYDDIENADIKGESLLQLSVTNFETEVTRLAESIPVEVRETNCKSNRVSP